jgi:hypothetical protein
MKIYDSSCIDVLQTAQFNLPSFKEVSPLSSLLPKRFSRETPAPSDSITTPDSQGNEKTKKERAQIALHPNILPPLAVLTTPHAFFLISDYFPYTLQQYVHL